jgi:hypothetical protein
MKGEKDAQALARSDTDSEENKDDLRLFGKLAAFITLCAFKL